MMSARERVLTGALEGVILNFMPTTISLPPDLRRQADDLARRLKKSPTALYRSAIIEYVARHESAPSRAPTAAMDRVASRVDTRPDGFVRLAAAKVLRDTEW